MVIFGPSYSLSFKLLGPKKRSILILWKRKLQTKGKWKEKACPKRSKIGHICLFFLFSLSGALPQAFSFKILFLSSLSRDNWKKNWILLKKMIFLRKNIKRKTNFSRSNDSKESIERVFLLYFLKKMEDVNDLAVQKERKTTLVQIIS